MTQEHTAHTDHRRSYYAVLSCLLVLTALTVYSASVDLSYVFKSMNIVVAMVIASIKATLVGLYFMHLKYDRRLNKLVYASSFLFLAIFILITASDVFFRPPGQMIMPQTNITEGH